MSDLIGDPDRFVSRYLHRQPLIGSRTDLARLPSSEALWDSILTRGARQPAFRVVRAGETTGRGGVTRAVGIGNRRPDDVVDANAVIERYRAGDTIVLQALHHTNAELAKLVTNLSLALDEPTQVNAYLSPPDDQGLDIHFDYHDVIVIQVAGTKSWRIWDRLPRTTDPVRTGTKVPPLEADELGAPAYELTLSPGDVIYLPRGFPHVATTTNEASEHLTIGITAIGWNRFVKAALDAAVEDGAFRAEVPARSLASTPADPSQASFHTEMPSLDPLVAAMATVNYRHWLAQQVWQRMPQTRLRPRAIQADPDHPLRFTAGPLLWLTNTNTRSVIGLGDRLLDLPLEAHDFLEDLFTRPEPIATDALDLLDAKSRRVILNRLIAVGVLAPCPSP